MHPARYRLHVVLVSTATLRLTSADFFAAHEITHACHVPHEPFAREGIDKHCHPLVHMQPANISLVDFSAHAQAGSVGDTHDRLREDQADGLAGLQMFTQHRAADG